MTNLRRRSGSGRLAKRFAGDTCGAAAIFTAVVFAVLMWCGAFAVDVGALYFERRHAQGAVDLAAMAAAEDIAAGEERARAALRDNRIGAIAALTVTPGHYRADPATAPEHRFTANEEPFNAVHVRLRKQSPLYFGAALLGVKSWDIQTQAVAVNTKQAAFSIGSRLLRLEGGIVNGLLEALLGGSLRLTAMDYNALADAKVDMFDYMDALATELDLEAASYDEVLKADATAGQMLDAMTTVTAGSGQGAAALVLQDIRAGTNAGGTSVPLNKVVDLGPYGDLSANSSAPGFSPSVNAMQMVSAMAAIANGGNQVSLDLGAAIPGLANLRVDVAIGEPPQNSSWISVGGEGSIVRTAQTRLRLVADIGGGALPGGLAVRVPLYTEIAYAEGRIEDITCGADVTREGHVSVAARPGIAELWLGEIDPRDMGDFSSGPRVGKAQLVKTPLAQVRGRSHTAITNLSETVLEFDWDDIQAQTVKSTSTRDILASALPSLLRSTDIEVDIAGLGLGLPGPLKTAVRNVLAAAAPALDAALGGVLEALGLTLGEADITVHGIRCDGAALVG